MRLETFVKRGWRIFFRPGDSKAPSRTASRGCVCAGLRLEDTHPREGIQFVAGLVTSNPAAAQPRMPTFITDTLV
jgi:hypothetical protein